MRHCGSFGKQISPSFKKHVFTKRKVSDSGVEPTSEKTISGGCTSDAHNILEANILVFEILSSPIGAKKMSSGTKAY